MILVSVARMMNYCDLCISSNGHIKGNCQYLFIRHGAVQAFADNFDANITSPNGLKSTHALARLMTWVCPNSEDGQEDTTIKRLKKEDIKDSTLPGTLVSYYHGPKKT